MIFLFAVDQLRKFESKYYTGEDFPPLGKVNLRPKQKIAVAP